MRAQLESTERVHFGRKQQMKAQEYCNQGEFSD